MKEKLKEIKYKSGKDSAYVIGDADDNPIQMPLRYLEVGLNEFSSIDKIWRNLIDDGIITINKEQLEKKLTEIKDKIKNVIEGYIDEPVDKFKKECPAEYNSYAFYSLLDKYIDDEFIANCTQIDKYFEDEDEQPESFMFAVGAFVSLLHCLMDEEVK